jgi:hypothetical protein
MTVERDLVADGLTPHGDAPVHCRDRVAEAPDHDDECPFGAP